MNFKIGGGSSKSSGTMSSTDVSNATKTSTLPSWLLQPYQDATAKVTALSGTDPSTLVPGADPLQTQASKAAANLGSPWNFDGAIGTTRDLIGTQTPQVTAASSLDNLSSYYNPFLKQVINPVAADQDANAARTRAAQTLDLAGSGAFGGSGAGVAQAQTEGELARARAAALSPLYQANYTTALSASDADASRRQAASTANSQLSLQDQQEKAALAAQLAGLSAAKDQNASANIGTQEAVGGVNRQIATDQAQAPFNFQAWLESALNGLNPSLFATQNIDSTDNKTGTQSSKGSNFNWGAGVDVKPNPAGGFSFG
jgi:hypothetical protein